MASKIFCKKCGGCQVVPQSGEKCVECSGSGYASMEAILFYIHALEKKAKSYEDSTHGESGRLDSSNAESERDAANKYATDAKKEIESLHVQLSASQVQTKAAVKASKAINAKLVHEKEISAERYDNMGKWADMYQEKLDELAATQAQRNALKAEVNRLRRKGK